jgi:hypothetical protein
MREPGRGFGGFLVYRGTGKRCCGERGFLGGSAGVTLALLAATTDIDSAWDRALLLS